MQKEDIQKELLKETVEPNKALTKKALAKAIKNEMGTLNQLKMNASKTELQNNVIGLQNTVIDALHGERNAITVVLKTTLRRFAENLKILTPIQNLSHGSIMLKKMIKLRMLTKFRLILTPIWNQTTHRTKIIV